MHGNSHEIGAYIFNKRNVGRNYKVFSRCSAYRFTCRWRAGVSLDSEGIVSYDAAKALLFEIMHASSFSARDALIEMAQKGGSRPLRMTHLGKCLHDYTSEAGDEYDAEFDKGMRELVPYWFESEQRG